MKRGVLGLGIEASLVCNMGRMVAHTGREITFEEMVGCGHEFAPGLAGLTRESAAPLVGDGDGLYLVPRPGVLRDREY